MNDNADQAPDDSHPSDEGLRLFSIGQMDNDLIDRVADHIAACPSCVERLGQMEKNATENNNLIRDLKQFDSSAGSFAVSESAPPENADPMWAAIESLGKYRVLKKLGAGGMGSIYLAEHQVMDRQVAIKVIRSEFLANPEAVIRFRNEVRHAARLSHRNIVTAHDAEQVEGVHFLVMEHVQGESLSQLVRRKGPLSVKHACNYILQVAHGLNHSHENRMVHRDIKPANLMRTPRGAVKILDFGLARLNDAEDSLTLTSTGVMMGTADYIAPEQARDAKSADIRSDLYSLGCTFFFLLTKQPPFQAETKVDKIIAHCSTSFPDASLERADLPVGVLKIIDKLTAKDPNKRYQTPRQLIKDLAPFGKPTSQNKSSADAEPAPQLVSQTASIHSSPSKIQIAPSKTAMGNTPATRRRFSGLLISAVAILLLAPLAWLIVSSLNGGGSGDERSNNGTNKSKAATTSTDRLLEGRPTVLLVMSSQKFWFSDYKPIERILQQQNVNLIVTANRVGPAQFNTSTLDPMPNKHPVEIKQSVSELVDQRIHERIDAVIFIGTTTQEFRQDNRTGRAVQTLLKNMRTQNKWITSLGKGSEVPIQLGFYDDIEVCDTEHLDSRVRRFGAKLVAERLLEVAKSKVLTGSMWDDAEDFARKLVEILHR